METFIAENIAFIAFLFLCCLLSGCTVWQLSSGIKPFWMPFNIFKKTSRFGEVSVISENQGYFDSLIKHSFHDPRYQEWRDELLTGNEISQGEYLSLTRKQVDERYVEILFDDD